MRIIGVKLPDDYVEGLKTLVMDELYPTQNEAIRVALRNFLREYLSNLRGKSVDPSSKQFLI